MPRLIINADDFGLTLGVNRAIAEAHAAGTVTSATLMANGPAFDDAVRIARSLPSLAVGCHVVLIDGVPLSDPEALSTLTVRGPSRHFQSSVVAFARRALTRQLNEQEIEREAILQIRKVQNAGIHVSHLDTHKHTHLFPAVLAPLLRAAKTCNVAAVRNPLEPETALPASYRRRLWKRQTQVRALRWLARDFRSQLTEAGIATTDGTLGITATGHLTAELFHFLLQSIPEGTWEFVCHPGYDDPDLRATHTRLTHSRTDELNILTSIATQRQLTNGHIRLISFRDL